MLMEPPMLPPHYRIFPETLVNNLVVLYLRVSGGIACYKQEFGLSKTGHGLDDAVLGLLPKHLTLLSLLLDVDMLSERLRPFCVQPWADSLICAPAFLIGSFISQWLGSVLWISLGLGLPSFMLGLMEFPLGTIHLFLRLFKL